MKFFYYESQCLSENSLEACLDEGLISKRQILAEAVVEASLLSEALALEDQHLARDCELPMSKKQSLLQLSAYQDPRLYHFLRHRTHR